MSSLEGGIGTFPSSCLEVCQGRAGRDGEEALGSNGQGVSRAPSVPPGRAEGPLMVGGTKSTEELPLL